MSLVDKILGLFGRQREVDENTAANRARQRTLHGQGFNQTSDETAGTRQRMEAELDEQRARRAEPPAP